MTLKQVFLATQIELNKVQAPSLSLIDFNYLANKAVNQYVNRCYTMVYDVNQQATDDLRVLKATAYLKPTKPAENEQALRVDRGANASSYLSTLHTQIQSLDGATYEVTMPSDYLHLLNCICVYYVEKQKDCWDAGSYIQIPATRLTADSWGLVVNDIYNRPTPTRPYYYIHNVNTSIEEPTNIYNSDVSGSTDFVDTNVGYNITPIDEVWERRTSFDSSKTWLLMPSNSKLNGLTADNYTTNVDTLWYIDGHNNLKVDINDTPYYIWRYINQQQKAKNKGITRFAVATKQCDKWENLPTKGVEAGAIYMITVDKTTGIGVATYVNDEWKKDTSKTTACCYNNHLYTHINEEWDDEGLYDPDNGDKEICVLTATELQGGATVHAIPNADNTHNAPRTFVFNKKTTSAVEKPSYVRHANVAQVRMEIRYGRDDSIFKLKEVRVDYLKAPQHLRLSQEQFDLTEDVSQMMEFPDYVNQEIINELVHLVMEHNNDPRLSNNLQITQSIARPTGQQTQSTQA